MAATSHAFNKFFYSTLTVLYLKFLRLDKAIYYRTVHTSTLMNLPCKLVKVNQAMA